ncbi:hypothetical protein ACQ4PT_042243 [Festuca glaucescens]
MDSQHTGSSTDISFRRSLASPSMLDDIESRRREISLGKRPAEEVHAVTVADSSDDDSSTRLPYPPTDLLRTEVDPLASSRWTPLTDIHSSTFYTTAASASPSSAGHSIYIHRTPFTPVRSAASNRRLCMLMRRHRSFMAAGYRFTGHLPMSEQFVNVLKRSWPRRSYFSAPHHVCKRCGAFFWYRERNKSLSTAKKIVYTGCCRGGKVSLPVYPHWPSPLAELLRFDGDAQCNKFMRLIREYNYMFVFTSLGVHVDRSVNVGSGPYVFKICGVVCHEIGSLLPPTDNPVPKFAQLYIYDTQNELDHRMGILSPDDDDDDDDAGLPIPVQQPSSSSRGHRRRRDPLSDVDLSAVSSRSVRPRRNRRDEPDHAVVDSLRIMLNEHDNLVKTFRMAEQRMFSPNAPEVGIRLFGHEGAEHGNRYSLPTAPELAALIVGDLDTERS